MLAYRKQLLQYMQESTTKPLFVCDDAHYVLQDMPDAAIDCCMTSPPYWNKREYHDGGIGREETYEQYMESLLNILCKIPLLATCPSDGIALDPFCGTGTTNLVAMKLSRKSVGIDKAQAYIAYAEDRCRLLM